MPIFVFVVSKNSPYIGLPPTIVGG